MGKSTYSVGLCEGRHDIGGVTDGYIFGREVPSNMVTDPDKLEQAAVDRLTEIGVRKGDDLRLYATGLTVALIATLNAAGDIGAHVEVWHYDRESGIYYGQEVRWL